MYIKLILFACLASTIHSGIHCAPVEKTIDQDTTLIDLKAPLSVDQALNAPSKAVKPEETTTIGQLFNNNDGLEEDKIFKLSDDDLIETSNLSPQAKQASTGGMPNVQSLIDQTNTISSNLETMIKDMVSA